VVIEVVKAEFWLFVVLLFVCLPALTRPTVLRAMAHLFEYANERGKARATRRTPVDQDQENLRLWSQRCRLCDALDRIERLLATDSWMSATRQMGNRLAYDQLVGELSRIPDVFPPRPNTPFSDLWAEPYPAGRRRARGNDDWGDTHRASPRSAAAPIGQPSKPGQVEILDIGWRPGR
jgi:hypothetical protein